MVSVISKSAIIKEENMDKKSKNIELEILRLIYADRMEQAYSKDMDEDWFRDAMEILSDGVFSCYGQGKYLKQEKESNWQEIFDLLHWLPYSRASVNVKVRSDDFNGIEVKSDVIESAKKTGWIEMDVVGRKQDEDKLFMMCNIKWDYGDVDGYGMETVNMWCTMDREGNLIDPFKEL